MEESYRGEPQTAIWAGLRAYQWAALAMTLSGGFVSAIAISAPAPAPSLHTKAAVEAAGFGFLVFAAYGVDLPASNRRFFRLA